MEILYFKSKSQILEIKYVYVVKEIFLIPTAR